MSALPSSRKTHSEKHKLILKQLLKEAPNKVCVDCKTAAHPRWASWNLGCFMCIRCSGIHRSMGTHISRVKSVDLDAWTDEQVESMVRWGNAKCNLFWEAKLPEGYVPDGLKIENFIRTKYDMKKWAASKVVSDPLSIPLAQVDERGAPSISTKPASVPTAAPIASALLLDDDFGVFTSSRPHTPSVPSPSPGPSKVQPKVAAKPRVEEPRDKHTASPAQATSGFGGRQDLKKSILSLYSTPSSSSSHVPAPKNNASSATLTDSLAGLNFGLPASSLSVASASSTPKPTQWDNEWSSSPVTQTRNYNHSAPLSANPTPLDDDLFKNVWN